MHRIDKQLTRFRALASGEEVPLDVAATRIVRALGKSGLLRWCVPKAHGGMEPTIRLQALCAIRDELAYRSGLADTMFAMQGLGSMPVTLAGTAAQKREILRPTAAGEAIGAFAITEPEAGSDVASMRATARKRRGGYVIDGVKQFISNAGIADYYSLFARTGKRISAFVIRKDWIEPGAIETLEVMAPHPIGTLRLRGCEVPARARLGREGDGLAIAYGTLGIFRATVAAAACGLARRALDEAVRHASRRRQFGRPLAKFQSVRFALAEMSTELAAARLLVREAADAHDFGRGPGTLSAQAKLFATEAAQRIVDRAVQIHGGRGVVVGETVERLYREVRALRIYEGTSEILKLIISNGMLGK